MTVLKVLALYFLIIGLVKLIIGIIGKVKSKHHTDERITKQ